MENRDLYDILNIPKEIILEQNNDINYWLFGTSENKFYQEKLPKINHAIAIINRFHSYFHFEQSFAYLLCAYGYFLKNEASFQVEYLTKAIFQDHINQQAIDFSELINGDLRNDLRLLFSYEKNLKLETEFLHFAIGRFKLLPDIEILDSEIREILTLNYPRAVSSNYYSHRVLIIKYVEALFNEKLEGAIVNILKAVKMLETSHQQYHQLASNIYLKRAEIFTKLGEMELSKNDAIKASDLFPFFKNDSNF